MLKQKKIFKKYGDERRFSDGKDFTGFLWKKWKSATNFSLSLKIFCAIFPSKWRRKNYF